MDEQMTTDQAKQRLIEATALAEAEAQNLTLRAPGSTLARAFAVGVLLGGGKRLRGAFAEGLMWILAPNDQQRPEAADRRATVVVKERPARKPREGKAATKVRAVLERRMTQRCRV
jgi:hypothetical protein